MQQYEIKFTLNNEQVTVPAIGIDADTLVRSAKSALERHPAIKKALGKIKLWGLKRMGVVAFARQVVDQHNRQTESKEPLPNTAQQFIDWAVRAGYATPVPVSK